MPTGTTISELDNAKREVNELQTMCEDYLAWLKSADYCEDEDGDRQHEIFEKAMEVSLGANIWDEINSIKR